MLFQNFSFIIFFILRFFSNFYFTVFFLITFIARFFSNFDCTVFQTLISLFFHKFSLHYFINFDRRFFLLIMIVCTFFVRPPAHLSVLFDLKTSVCYFYQIAVRPVWVAHLLGLTNTESATNFLHYPVGRCNQRSFMIFFI